MRKSIVFTPAYHLEREIRRYVEGSGFSYERSDWDGSFWFAFALGEGPRRASASSLMPILANLPPKRQPSPMCLELLLGSDSALAESLARSLDISVLVAHVSDTNDFHVLIAWQGDSVTRIHLLQAGASLSWAPDRGFVELRRQPERWKKVVDGWLVQYDPHKQRRDFETFALRALLFISGVRELPFKAKLFAGALALVGAVKLGEWIGAGYGQGDLGAVVAFCVAIGGPLLLIRKMRPADSASLSYERPLRLALIGFSLLVLSWALGQTDLAMVTGVFGVLTLAVALGIAYFS